MCCVVVVVLLLLLLVHPFTTRFAPEPLCTPCACESYGACSCAHASHFMPTCMLCLHATHPHILTMYVHTLPNFERVYAYCIHVRDNIRSEESNMQYLFLEPLQLTMKHLPTPPAYTSASSKNSMRENSLTLLSISLSVYRRLRP
jgi:hypothetical protein